MKRKLLQLLTFLFLNVIYTQLSAQPGRFLQEVFPSVTVTPDIIYASNYQVLTGSPVLVDLKMDVYQPAGATDPLPTRPLIIYLHTGSFIPPVLNKNPTGSRTDSTVVEMCSQFARRGYVAAAVSYRLGWNPTSSDQDERTGSLLQAVYRAIQDVKANVRYWREEAAINGNPFLVDTNKIILCGQGTGGYLSLAYSSLNNPAEINLAKFLSNTNNASYFFNIGLSYVNQAVWGDFDGYGGNVAVNNPNNHVGYSNAVNFAINMGGAMGDSTWIEAGDVPMIAFHVTNDPFAPFGQGPVYVPTSPPQYVVDVAGSQKVIEIANQLNNNDCFQGVFTTDPYSVRANSINGGFDYDGLFPLERPINPNTGLGEAGPWEWFDQTALQQFSTFVLGSPAYGDTAFFNGLATNPDMSKQKALAYIDTIQNYLAPRLALCLSLPTGIENQNLINNLVSVYPNPASDLVTIKIQAGILVNRIVISDATGRTVYASEENATGNISVNTSKLSNGLYSIRLETEKGVAVNNLTIAK